MVTVVPHPFGHALVEGPRRIPPTHDVVETAQLRVRVPIDVKRGIEAAARRAGVPAELWLIESIEQGLDSPRF